jgi:tryptophan synthase alpha chain
MGPTPVAVGLGIASADQARQVRDWGADGAIVGSALVKVMAAAAAAAAPQEPAPATAAAAAAFCAELRAALDH